MAVSEPEKVCVSCKGVGAVRTPVAYAMPMKTVHWITCVPCHAKERMAADDSPRRSG